MSIKPPLGDNPSLRSFLRRTTEWSITSILWIIWIYLFLPLMSLILWLVGLPYIYRTLFQEEVVQQFFELLGRIGWVVLIIFVVLRGWGLYNYYMFGRRNRRKQHTVVTIDDISRHFNMTPDEVRALQGRKEIVWTLLYDNMRAGGKN
jgi:biofilm PGA synthesis protein PgaD